MEESAQLNENGTHDDTLWLREFRDNSSVTRTQMCSLKVPTTPSWSIVSYDGSASPFKAIGTQFGSFDKVEIPDESDRKPGGVLLWEKWVIFYKQKRTPISAAVQLLEENLEMPTEIDVPLNKEQHVAQRLNSQHKFIPIGRILNNENKR